ncbi:hypothetical protein V8G54_032518 [Vigna mungo]|uniref:RNA polymerase Rpb4/RPC9 core domain-containing protein n=1 Tax=Vigna mungo TaxID=3915 RepID=A0AAQ3RIW2_VIGMU
MSEKGGKGGSLLSKGGALDGGLGSMKGKDDSATKSARGRRVQFSKDGPYESGISSSSPISLKSGGKGEGVIPEVLIVFVGLYTFVFYYFHGDFIKGGKGDKVANGGKSSQSKDSQSSEHGVDQKLPENIKCLMDCEAADILQGIQDQMVMLSRDSTIKMPTSFDKGLQYARSTSKYTNAQSVRHVLEPLANNGLNDCEICVTGNVCPESADEVFALLPTLKGKRNVDKEVLKDSLIELAKLRQPM